MSGIKSKIYWIILAVIILGYGFFFVSRFIFHETKNYLYTEPNTKVKLSEEVSLTLKKWTYSKNDKTMMVMFSADNESLSELELNWATYERHTEKLFGMDTGSTEMHLKTEVAYPFGNMVVVSISGVPVTFEEVSLSLQLASDDDSNNKIVQFYSNVDKVEAVDSIGDYTPNDYRIEYLGIQKSDKENEIKELTIEISKLTQDNKAYHKTISELAANKDYETAEEIEETNRKIKAYERQIERNEEAIEQNKYDISELRKAVRDIEGAIEKIKIPTCIQHLFFSNQTQKYSKYAYFRNLKMTFLDFQNPNPRNMHT